MRKPDHTTVRHNQLWVRLYIPAEVRPDFDGQTLFLEKLGPASMDFHQANAMAAAYVASWKRQIESARHQPMGIDALTYGDAAVTDDALELMNEDELRSIARAFVAQAQQQQKSSPTIVASASDGPFLTHFDEWQKATHLKAKTLDQAVSDVRQFDQVVGANLNLSGGVVQEWIDGQLKTISAVTVRRKLSAIRSYWTWMQSREFVGKDRDPFHGRLIMDHRTKAEREADKRVRYEPEQMTQLFKACANDPALLALVKLAAYTGARREGLSSLQTDSIVKVEGIPSFRLKEKSEAGVRHCPIHPAISKFVTALVNNARRDGFR